MTNNPQTPDSTITPLKKSKSIYKSILNKTDLMEWVDHCKQKKIIAIDTETNSLNYIEAELVGISLSIDEGKAIYIPLAHDYELSLIPI